MKLRTDTALYLSLLAALLATAGSLLLWLPDAVAREATGADIALTPDAWKWGILAAALATGLSSLAAAYVVARVGSAAVGALVEKPELFGRLLVLVGLAEGIAIYGLIISILILNRLL